MNFELENFRQFKKFCGIYKISFGSHNYVGSSKNVASRLRQHYHSLKKGRHFSTMMQNCFNKYWETATFEFVEACEEKMLLKRETYYIDLFKADINLIKDPSNITRPIETLRKMSKNLKKYYETHESESKIPVYMYSLNGEYIAEFPSAIDASKKLNCSNSGISSAARNKKFASGFLWRYEKYDKIDPYNKKYQNVVQLDSDGNLIKRWNSWYEAAYYLELNVYNIKQAVRDKTEYGGFLWKIREVYKRKPIEEWKPVGKKVYQYDLNGNYLAEYKNVNEASRQTGINNHGISSAALDRCEHNKSAGGFMWSYEKLDCLDPYVNNSDKAKIVSVVIFNCLTGDEREFESIADAVRYIDNEYIDSAAASISGIMRKGGFYKYYLAKGNSEYIIPKRNIKLLNTYTNIVYDNIVQCSSQTGINKYWLKKYCLDTENSEWIYLSDCARLKLRESGKVFIER